MYSMYLIPINTIKYVKTEPNDYLCELQEGFDVLRVDAVLHEGREGGHDGRLSTLAVSAAEGQRQGHGVGDLHTEEDACLLAEETRASIFMTN